MAYEGELLRYCPRRMYQFKNAYVVVVSGGDLIPHVWHNNDGHMLLNTGGPGGDYFQVGGDWKDFPRVMNEAQFQRYLRENKKYIITVFRVSIPHPEKSQLRLEQALSEKRRWLGYWNNCESLVEEIIMAGGGPRIHKGRRYLPMESTDQCTAW